MVATLKAWRERLLALLRWDGNKIERYCYKRKVVSKCPSDRHVEIANGPPCERPESPQSARRQSRAKGPHSGAPFHGDAASASCGPSPCRGRRFFADANNMGRGSFAAGSPRVSPHPLTCSAPAKNAPPLRAVVKLRRRQLERLDDLQSVSDCAGRWMERDRPTSSSRSAGLAKVEREGYRRLTY
jgi:hypothetical protein